MRCRVREGLDDQHINQHKSPTISNQWRDEPNAGEQSVRRLGCVLINSGCPLSPNVRLPQKADLGADIAEGRFVPIVLQKSKVAEPRIFRENTKQERVADSYTLNRIIEVACEFNAR